MPEGQKIQGEGASSNMISGLPFNSANIGWGGARGSFAPSAFLVPPALILEFKLIFYAAAFAFRVQPCGMTQRPTKGQII